MFSQEKCKEIYEMLEASIDQRQKDLLAKGDIVEFKLGGGKTLNYTGYVNKQTKQMQGPGIITWLDENGNEEMVYAGNL
jgi:hypothetical protein